MQPRDRPTCRAPHGKVTIEPSHMGSLRGGPMRQRAACNQRRCFKCGRNRQEFAHRLRVVLPIPKQCKVLVEAILIAGMKDFPELGVVGCADAPTLEHVPVVMEPRADVPAAVGLTPGVASSVAPRGTPIAPTDAPGPIPSGEVTPSGTGAPVPTVPWANALLQPRRTDTVVVTNKRLIRCHP